MVKKEKEKLYFDVSTGLKRVLGRELITDDEVAVFELVKNSFDAGADTVHLYFGKERIVVADNGTGMTYEDLTQKWLFVAYSSKRTERPEDDFRNVAADRRHFAGSKGIGRFSSDRLGKQVVVQSRAKDKGTNVHQLTIDWELFEKNDQDRFGNIPVAYAATSAFDLPSELTKFADDLKHGTVIDIRKLRQQWDRTRILALKSSLAKLINPFGDQADRFSIHITAPKELEEDAKKTNHAALSKDIVNGPVGNFIFATLQDKTTFIRVSINGDQLNTTLTDRGELIYRIREPNPYTHLKDSGFVCEIYYLNQSAKTTFTRRIGLQPVQFGSVFLFRNNFRVYPIGEDGNDWFGFNRRKQQGYSRYLGTREIIGRVDVFGSDEDFKEASSRNQGLIDTLAVQQLRRAVMEHCLKRLEKYVVPVSWVDKADANTENLSRLLTDSGRARVSVAVANLVNNDQIELLEYSQNLIGLINERSENFEESLVSLRAIAEKTEDKKLLTKLDAAERRFDELKRSEAEARKVADQARLVSAAATQRAETAEVEAEVERRRSHFLESIIDLDATAVLNLHHQITIYAVDLAQQIENLLVSTIDKENVPRESMLKAMEQMAFLNRKILAVTRFAARAKFKLDSELIETDLPGFIADYIEQIARASGSVRLRIDVVNEHPGMTMRFKPIDTSIIVDNLVSNARRAKASKIKFELMPLDKHGLLIRATDNGRGFTSGTDKTRIFEIGYTTTQGSGLGLYHVRQVLGEMGGSIELEDSEKQRETTFVMKITPVRGKS